MVKDKPIITILYNTRQSIIPSSKRTQKSEDPTGISQMRLRLVDRTGTFWKIRKSSSECKTEKCNVERYEYRAKGDG
jgi:hypothetical protein